MTKSTKPVPSLIRFLDQHLFYIIALLSFLLFVGCAGLPIPPKNSPLCVFTNIYIPGTPASASEPLMDAVFKQINKNIKENPSLIADPKKPKVMPADLAYFVCRNSSSTKYFISVKSESADKMIATPFSAYLDLQAYYKKLADVFTKELNARTGGK